MRWNPGDTPTLAFTKRNRRVATRAAGFLNEYWNTLALIFSRGALGRTETSLRSRLEILVYRVLVACFAIALANSNSSLRQLIHAIG